MIILASHASSIDGKLHDGLTNNLIELLENNKKDFLLIRHSMDGRMPSIIYFYKRGELVRQKKLGVISGVSCLRYVTEVVSTLLYFITHKTEVKIYIGIDPLNAFSGIMLKKLGIVRTSIFYTSDYSPNRFKNKVLNSIYHRIDSFCVSYADRIWNVSQRICQIREKMGAEKERNLFLPNIPSDEYKKFIANKKEIHTLITLGLIGEQLDFLGVFEAIKKLKNDYPDILFKIVGNGPKEHEYKKYVKDNDLEKNIVFLGYLDHLDALREISKSGVGLALYNGKWEFNYYGDSVKCREYFCFGLPVVTTNTHATVEEIESYRAGIICEIDSGDYFDAIKKIFDNYQEYSRNSQCLSEKYSGLHKKLIEKYLS